MNFITVPYGALQGLLESGITMMYGIFGNYGLAIIGITILIKLVLLPLTLKQDRSMSAMKRLQPELDALKTKHKNDPQTLNQKTIELYKIHKVNPASGCLPILLQMPILFALFGVLRKTGADSVIADNASFLWLTLSTPDPMFILPLLNGAVSFFQQNLMSETQGNNPQMKMMMYMFPVMMIFISYKMPSGLQLYWVVSSMAAVAQQYYIMSKRDKG
jgi:YidC/Oxa1 family membrane protein insertase